VAAGGPALTLTVNGSGFTPASAIYWNAPVPSTFVSANQLTAAIPASSIAAPATVNICVGLSGANSCTTTGVLSNIVPFTIALPGPPISILSPSTAQAGGPAFTLAVSGYGFINSVILWNGTALPTTMPSPTQCGSIFGPGSGQCLTAPVAASLIATPGTVTIVVSTSGDLSNGLPFTITAPPPAITGLSPSTIPANGPSFTLTVNGSGFVSNSIVGWNGTALATTFVSASQLTASVAASLIASPGSATIAVTNSGKTSNNAAFTIAAPPPSIGGLIPSTALAGGPLFTLTVNGAGFAPNSVVQWNGSALPTSFVSASQITATVAANLTASPETATISLDTNGHLSNSLTFTIESAGAQPFASVPAITPSEVNLNTNPFQPIAIKAAVSVGYNPTDSTTSDPNTAPVPGGVKLMLVNADGTQTLVATLNDDGEGPDLTAGDGIYSGTAVLNATEANNGIITLVASVAFPGESQNVISGPGTVQLFPPGVPLSMPPESVQSTCGPSGAEFMCSELLLFTNPGNDYPEVSIFAGTVAGTVAGVLTFPQENIWMIKLRADSTGQNVLDDVKNFAGSQTLRAVQPNYISYPAGVTPNDTYYGRQWGIPQVGLDKAWAITTGNIIQDRASTLYIGIVDSGIDTSHPDLMNPKVAVQKDWTDESTNATLNNVDRCGHGTSVAGVAAGWGDNNAGIAGASWAALLIAEKISTLGSKLNAQGVWVPACISDVAFTASGIKDAAQNGATVVNMSLASRDHDGHRPEADAIHYLNSLNRVFVAAAGNCGVVSLPSCPVANAALYPGGFQPQETFSDWIGNTTLNTALVSVGATTQAGPVANFSNYGQPQEIYAPGDGIYVPAILQDSCLDGLPKPQGLNRICSKSGTSFAAPLVAGVASLLRAARPLVSNIGIRAYLQNQGAPGTDLSGSPTINLNAFHSLLFAARIPYSDSYRQQSVSRGIIGLSAAGQPRTGMQPAGMYGISLPLAPATSYDVTFSSQWSTWDSYSNSMDGGYFDAFSLSLSATPYSEIARPNADLLTNASFHFGFSSPGGGETRGSGTLQTTGGAGRVTTNIPGFANGLFQGNNFLNVILDTSAGPNADTKWPSWGSYQLVDITPHQ